MISTESNGARTRFPMVIGALVLLLVILAGAFFLVTQYPYRTHKDILVAFGYGPIRGVYSVGADLAEPERFVLKDNPGFYVTDLSGGKDNMYLMLAQLDVRATQVYKMEPGGGLVQVTKSDTFKYDISVDTESNRLVYVTSAAATPQELIDNEMGTVTLFDESLGEETVIGTGKNPVLLNGGSQILFETPEGLVSHVVSQSSSTLVLPMENQKRKTLYAINPQEETIAIYRPESRTIEFYEIYDSEIQQKVDSSRTLTYIPQLLSYANGELWASVLARGDMGQEEFVFIATESGELGESVYRTNLSQDLIGYPLEIYSSYE